MMMMPILSIAFALFSLNSAPSWLPPMPSTAGFQYNARSPLPSQGLSAYSQITCQVNAFQLFSSSVDPAAQLLRSKKVKVSPRLLLAIQSPVSIFHHVSLQLQNPFPQTAQISNSYNQLTGGGLSGSTGASGPYHSAPCQPSSIQHYHNYWSTESKLWVFPTIIKH